VIGLLALTGALAVVVGLVLGALTAPPADRSAGSEPEPVASPSDAHAPTASPSWAAPTGPRSSTGSPSASRSADRSRPSSAEVLHRNPLYHVRLPVGEARCRLKVRPPRPPLPEPALHGHLTDIVACLTESLTPPLDRVGIDLHRPAVVTFRHRIRTPCGVVKSSTAPASYCAAARTLYWPLDRRTSGDAYSAARLGYVALAAHEYGHHLQASAGIMQTYAARRADLSPGEREEFTRRLELQTQCFEGAFLAHARDLLSWTGQDRYELRLWHSTTGDEDPPHDRAPDHGTSRAQIRWLFRGLDSGDLGRCNTWEAPSSAVR
jgi:uncharacterized protein